MYGFHNSPDDDTKRIWVRVDENGNVHPMSDEEIEVFLDSDNYPFVEDEE